MRESRSTSPMPVNIEEIRDSLPKDTIYRLPNRNLLQIPMHLIRRIGTKLLYGGTVLGGLYGAYKLGQHRASMANTRSASSNYTRSNR